MEFMNDSCGELEAYSMNCTLTELRNLSSYSDPNCSDALSSVMEARCRVGGVCQASDGQDLERGITIGVVLVLSLIGNIFTVMILSQFKVHKVPDVLVVGLALTDLLATLLPIPMATYAYFAGINYSEGCILCNFFGIIAAFTRFSSSQMVTLVSIERYLAVNRPFIYRKHVTPKKFIIVLIISWLLAFLLAVFPLFDGDTIIDSHIGFCLFDITSYYAIAILVYSAVQFVAVFVCFLLVTIELAKVYRRRKKLKVQDKYNSNSRAHPRDRALSFTKSNLSSRISDLGKSIKKAAPIITEKFQLSVEAQFARMLFAVVALFYISWTTIVVVIVLGQIQQSVDGLQNALFWGIRLSVISTAINPLLYGILARQYRLAYYYVFRLWFSKCCPCVSPPLKDVFAAARTVGGDPHERRGSQSRYTHSVGSQSYSYSGSMFGSNNVKLTNTTHITLPPTLHKIHEELSLEPNESSIAAEFSTHVPTAGELSSSVTIPYQARDHNDSSTVDLQVRGAASMHDLVDSGMVELGLSRNAQEGIQNPLAMMTKVVGGEEVLISPGGSEASENAEDTNPLFSNPVYNLANGTSSKTSAEIEMDLNHRQNMLAASSTDDITLISKKTKVAKTRSNDIPHRVLPSRNTPPLRGGTLPLTNGSPRHKTAHQSYKPLQNERGDTRFPLEKSHRKYMRDTVTATDIDSGRSIVVHSHDNLSNLGNGTSISHPTSRGGKRGDRASSFSPAHDRPTSVPTFKNLQVRSKTVDSAPVEPNTVAQPNPELTESKVGVWKLKERFESPFSSTPNHAVLCQSDSAASQSLQSPVPGTGERRSSTENSDSGHESMVLESDTAVAVN